MNNTFRNSEDKRFDEMFPNIDGIGGSHGIWIKSVFAPYSLEVKSFLHESQRRMVEKLAKELSELKIDKNFDGNWQNGFYEAKGLAISIINQTLK